MELDLLSACVVLYSVIGLGGFLIGFLIVPSSGAAAIKCRVKEYDS